MIQSNDLYIIKDVFDARMDRLEALMRENNTRLEAKINDVNTKLEAKINDANTRLEAKIDNVRTELKGEIQVLSERVDQNFAYLNMKIDSLTTYVGWGFAIIAIVVALLSGMITFAPSMWSFMKKQRRTKSTVSKKEIENIINTSLEKFINLQNK
ncbi:MAG: hypothetical protein IJ667_04620 [Synergistaceae bacterium]|nr:hypothetical protein [Synergistaceae bacterium]